MLRMDRVHVIRHEVLVEGHSLRSAARQMGMGRNTTIKEHLKMHEPVGVVRQKKPSPVKEMATPRIDQILQERRQRTTHEQRITGTRPTANSWGRLPGRQHHHRARLPPGEAQPAGRGLHPAGAPPRRGSPGGLLRGHRRGGRPDEKGVEVRGAADVLG